MVVDECHRLAADRFDAFVKAVRPRVLLGLTATPERSDGQPIAQYFDARPDGSPAVELRLWHALDLQLLAPFEYYACDDATDFSAVPWDKPGEREAVDKLVTGNRRARPAGGQRMAPAGVRRRAVARHRVLRVGRARRVHDGLAQPRRPASGLRGRHNGERRAAPGTASACSVVSCARW